MDPIYIVTSTNDNYAKPLGVMLNSLLENTADKSRIKIFIIDGNISPDNKQKLRNVVNKFNVKTTFLKVDNSLFKGFQDRGHVSKECYYRVVIPNLLNKNIRKALYLDCDTIVKDDISKLWSTNLDGYYLAAGEKAFRGKPSKNSLKHHKNSNRFNSGVLLINLEKWRKSNMSKKVLQYIKNYPKPIGDQAALNTVIQDKWLKLDPKWNYTTDHLILLPKVKPAIVHYTRSKKPWNHGHPLQNAYFKYLRTTSWK
ncbi:glycosyltransferase family 8 protein [Paenibacillus sedimenti]|uniref:glycosyltransferase family 8 protein n=1 Tax=Paenibacillus sedimenti TaxID=2770274 RepID=UPI00165F2A31|nr:glycosyltransferase family 8 protein [Paenibacillus sedimenti]